MTIEIDQGKTQKILVFPDSDPEELSYEFCKTNNLDFGSLKYLKQEIYELVLKLKENQMNKFAERISEVIHEEDENNNSLSNVDLIKNTSIEKTSPGKIETETDLKIVEKTEKTEENYENNEKSKETSKVANTFNYLCTTTENNFDIVAEQRHKPYFDTANSNNFSPSRNLDNKTNMTVFDKLYNDSRLRRMRSPHFKTFSGSMSNKNISPNIINVPLSPLMGKKTSLINQLNTKKFFDDQTKKVKF